MYKCTACQVVNIELKLNLKEQGKEADANHKIVYWIGIETFEKD